MDKPRVRHPALYGVDRPSGCWQIHLNARAQWAGGSGQGTVWIGDTQISKAPERVVCEQCRNIGIVFQPLNIYHHLLEQERSDYVIGIAEGISLEVASTKKAELP